MPVAGPDGKCPVNCDALATPARRLLAFLLAGLSIGIAACQPSDRAWSTGSVTFDGAPVEHGMIVFRPLDRGDAAGGASITDGRFTIASRPGRHRVEIRGMRPIEESRLPKMMPRIEGVPVYEDFIPPAFNVESTLEVDVAAGSGNAFTFDLQTPPPNR
jgi:hypothetical protein